MTLDNIHFLIYMSTLNSEEATLCLQRFENPPGNTFHTKIQITLSIKERRLTS